MSHRVVFFMGGFSAPWPVSWVKNAGRLVCTVLGFSTWTVEFRWEFYLRLLTVGKCHGKLERNYQLFVGDFNLRVFDRILGIGQ